MLVELYLASQTLEEKELNPALSTSYPGGKKLKPKLDTPDSMQQQTDQPLRTSTMAIVI